MNKKRPVVEIEYQNDKQWINGKPLKLDSLKGKVVLLDFWTYSCVNCIRTIPYLKEIWNKYKNKRFMLIGIHTPEFEFEKEIGNVKYAVKKYGLEWPILSDPLRHNWDNYGNQYWPRVAVIDSNGNIIFEHVGESGYDEVDKVISDELKKMKDIAYDSEVIERRENRVFSAVSREIYAGKVRGKEIDGLSCSNEGCDEYSAPDKRQGDKIYLQGNWTRSEEYLEYVGNDYEGFISFRFYAKEVNVVIGGAGKAEIYVDGKFIRKEDSGKDIKNENEKSLLFIEGADMYNVVNLKEYGSREVIIKPFKGMKVYSFTFG
jgi:thiol-disulfide isomerase/thioredoxin